MMRVLLVDDEEPARERMRRLLADAPGVEVVGEAAEIDGARAEIERHAPDVVLVDIEMPGGSGLELAATLPPPRPQLVFCTAYDQYALRAFELAAVDYLLKPVRRDRLAATLERVQAALVERREAESAAQTQQRQYGTAAPALERLEIDGICRPAREVGGDGFDIVDLGDARVCLLVADVAGKGLGAALSMSALLGRVQALAGRYDDPAELCAELNRQLGAALESGRYATLFLALWDDAQRTLTWVNAGHVPPLLLRADGTRESLRPTGTVVGLLDDRRWESCRTQLDPGDLLVAVTDGVTERADPNGDDLGEQRLAQIVIDAERSTLARLRDDVLASIERFADGGAPDDDATLLLARAR